MTDDQGWQPPSAPNPSSAGAPASPWVTPGSSPGASGLNLQQIPGWQEPAAPRQAPPAWAPPPKPGLIPLHPLSFGTIIGSSFRVIRRNPAPTFGLSVLLYGLITIVFFAFFGALLAFSLSRISSATSSDQSDIMAGSVGLIAVSLIIPVSLAVIATGVLQGIISLEVSRATLGEKLRVRGLWRLAKGRIAPLVGWSLLLTAIIIVFIVIASVVSVAVFAGVGVGSGNALGVAVGGFFLTMLFALGFAVLGAWVGTKVSLVPSIIMLERLTLGASIRRSWSLVQGNFWRTLGIQLLINVIVSTASSVITFPVSLIGGIVSVLVNPNSDSSVAIATIIITYVVAGILTVVVGAVGLVMQSASLALIYIDIRMRKEGLDLELLHFVEAKQAGTAGIDNPYLRLQGAGYSGTAPGYPGAPTRPGAPGTSGTPGASGSPWA